MKLTKYQHACFVAEKNGVSIVVDPGAYTHDFIMPKHVAAVFVSHNHPDHLNNQLIVTILRAHPKAVLLGDESVTAGFQNEHTQTVSSGETIDADGIQLKFVGGIHEAIDASMPTPPNLGVIVDNSLYYPGDSFYAPEEKIEILALPVSAPWLTFQKSADLARALKPRYVFPTHDAILSAEGQQLVDTMTTNALKDLEITYQRINGKTIEL